MKHCILDLWAEEQLPIKNGLYWADGRSLAMNIESYPHPRLKQGEWFDLSHFHECNPDETTYITMTKRIQLSNGGYGCVGEGSHGSEGFVAYLQPGGQLTWVMYSESSNPFVDIVEEANGVICAHSSANFVLRLHVDEPDRVKLNLIKSGT